MMHGGMCSVMYVHCNVLCFMILVPMLYLFSTSLVILLLVLSD